MGNAVERGEIDLDDLKCEHCGAQFRNILVKIVHEEECQRSRPSTAQIRQARAQQLEQTRKLEELKQLFAAFHITMAMLENDDDDDDDTSHICKPLVSMRVVRGPSWKWDEQDGGEGYVGTIIKLKPNYVDVVWDCGRIANYRVGINDSYDLLVLDSAPAGVKHTGVTCDGCSQPDDCVRGTRWKCHECDDVDLCTPCYMADKHLTRHKFIRFDMSQSSGCLVPARDNANEEKIQSKGIFPGATVVRGLNWGWGDQDGGIGSMGNVTKIIGFRDKQARDAASVVWGNGRENNYMVGCNGDVDLKTVSPGNGIKYYGESLLPCGVEQPVTTIRPFRIGDEVKFNRHPLLMKQMLRGHGGWHNHMIALMDKPGKVKGYETNNDVLVKYDKEAIGLSLADKDCMWRFNPAALLKC